MSLPEADHALRALFAIDEPTADDALFVLSVMQRIERRTAIAETATLVVGVALGAAVLLQYGAVLAPLVDSTVGVAWPGLVALAAYWLATSPWPARLLSELSDDRLTS